MTTIIHSFDARDVARRVWDWIKTRPSVWSQRFGSILKLSPEPLEVVSFTLMVLFIVYLNSQWFTGPYTIALHHAIRNGIAVSVTAVVAAFILFGFLEKNYWLRRSGSVGCHLVFLSVGTASISHFPHWLIGFLLLWASSVPLLCFLLLMIFQVKEEKQSDIPERAQRLEKERIAGEADIARVNKEGTTSAKKPVYQR